MKRIHIVGRKNHGKTALMADLVRELTAQGLRVGTIKHTSHKHNLDTPGKDSYQHRDAGANPSAIMTPDLLAVYISRVPDTDAYENLARTFETCDLVLVEGDLESRGVKVEVWRRAAGGHCLALDRDDIAAVVTDDPIETHLPVWPRNDTKTAAERIRELFA